MKNKQIKLLVERYPVLKAIENEVSTHIRFWKTAMHTAESCWLPEMVVLLRMRSIL